MSSCSTGKGTVGLMKARYENLDEYITDLKEGIASSPGCAGHYYNLGMAYLNKRDFLEAEKAFLEAVRQSPHMAEAYVQLGGIAMQRGDLEGCLNYNTEAVNARPRFAIGWGNIGFVHIQRGEAEKAIPALTKALKWDPKFIQAQASLAAAWHIDRKSVV